MAEWTEARLRRWRPFGALALAACLLASCQSELPPASTLEQRGARTLAEGSPREALVIFQQALAQNPHSFMAVIGLARCSIALKEWQHFATAQAKAQDMAPRNAAGFDILARTLLQAASKVQGGLRREYSAMAARFLVNASKEDGSFPRLAYHLGLSHYLSDRPRAAIPFLRRALQEEPEFRSAQEVMALCLEESQETRSLRAFIALLEKKGPLNPKIEKVKQRLGQAKSRPSPPK